MKKHRLGIGLVGGTELQYDEQLRLIAEVGFDEVFFNYQKDMDVAEYVAEAERVGLSVSSLHAPFMLTDRLWYPDEKTDTAMDELLSCIDACRDNGIDTVVMHVFIGFDRHEPTEAGLDAFGRVISHAEEAGVKIAFENTEGMEYFEAVMERYGNNPTVKICLDTGHEICYNPGRDIIAEYGDRLIYTHINDNLGVCGESITYLDDLHLLPFDGVLDFDELARRLAKVGYDGVLTFELGIISKPGRNENDKYSEMPFKDYINEAYRRAVKVRELWVKYSK